MIVLFIFRSETTRLYYFVYENGALVHPSTVTPPDTVVMETLLSQRVSGLVFYDGFLKIRYRFHFDLFMMGPVNDADRGRLTVAIHDIWKNNVKGLYLWQVLVYSPGEV